MTETVVAGAAAGLAVAVPLGPVGLFVVKTAVEHGRPAGIAAGAGVAAADALYASVAVTAGEAATDALSSHVSTLRAVAAGVLIGLAAHGLWRHARRVAPAHAVETASITRFFALLGMTLLNPQTMIAFTAIVIALPRAAVLSIPDKVLFVGAVGLSSLLWQSVLATIGAALRERAGATFQRGAILTGYLLIGLLGIVALMGVL